MSKLNTSSIKYKSCNPPSKNLVIESHLFEYLLGMSWYLLHIYSSLGIYLCPFHNQKDMKRSKARHQNHTQRLQTNKIIKLSLNDVVLKFLT